MSSATPPRRNTADTKLIREAVAEGRWPPARRIWRLQNHKHNENTRSSVGCRSARGEECGTSRESVGNAKKATFGDASRSVHREPSELDDWSAHSYHLWLATQNNPAGGIVWGRKLRGLTPRSPRTTTVVCTRNATKLTYLNYNGILTTYKCLRSSGQCTVKKF